MWDFAGCQVTPIFGIPKGKCVRSRRSASIRLGLTPKRLRIFFISSVLAASFAAGSAAAQVAPRQKPASPPPIHKISVEPGAVLSAEDVARYKEIFRVQEKGQWKTADGHIRMLDDRVLMGHVLFQRYMHPTAYRSKYKELKDWMARYADHPQASRIYKLALKRRPGGARPARPEKRRWRTTKDNPGLKSTPPKRSSSSKRRRVSQIERHVRSLLARERPTQALNYVNESRIRRDLTSHERDRIKQWIANSYYLENVDHKALRVANEVIANNRSKVPLADWTAGLATWRMGDKSASADHFDHVAKAKFISGKNRSAGAYWAARSYLVTREPEQVGDMLNIAAQAEGNFYGLLAKRQLGMELLEASDGPQVGQEDVTGALKLRGAARAVALAQVGKRTLAEQEMRRAHGKSDSKYDPSLMALAMKWDLPSVQIDIANYSDRPDLMAGLYPVPDFQPNGGFVLDKALVYAFVRQESKFDAEATSRAGARGLMQLMPRTAVHVSKDRSLRSSNKDRLYDPALNLMLGQKYIGELMNDYGLENNLFALLVAYNGGPGNLRKWQKGMDYQDDPLLFIESIPSRETRGFIEAVLTNYWNYQARLGQETPSLDHVVSGEWPAYVPPSGPNFQDQTN